MKRYEVSAAVLEAALQWNLRRRDSARRSRDPVQVNHFQRNADQLRAQLRVID